MKALTIYQPWASLIAHGRKRVENRGWKPFRNLVGKRIAIHAGKTWDSEFPGDLAGDLGELAERIGIKRPLDLPRGCIVATAIVVGWVKDVADLPLDQARWFCGPIGWVLGEVKPLQTPVFCSGSQGVWDVPVDIERRMAVLMVSP